MKKRIVSLILVLPIECDVYRRMPQQIAKSFNIKLCLNTTSCKSMPQCMKCGVANV